MVAWSGLQDLIRGFFKIFAEKQKFTIDTKSAFRLLELAGCECKYKKT